MASQESAKTDAPIDIDIKNIGGIDTRTETIPPGITVIVGENATNRTSFLQALMAALGSKRATLKGDAKEGEVSMTLDGNTYTRSLINIGTATPKFSGSGYLDDPELANLYAFLLSDNDVRRTVEQKGDLHEVLMRPIDTEHIDEELASLRKERTEIEVELEKINEATNELPTLEKQRRQLEDKRDALNEEIEELETEVERLQAETLSGEQQDKIEELDERINETQQEIADIETKINEIEARIAGIEQELVETGVDSEETVDSIREQIADLEDRRKSLKELINTFEELEENFSGAADTSRRLLNSNRTIEGLINQLPTDIDIPEGPLTNRTHERIDSPTAQLVEGDAIVCRSCGSEVTADDIRAIIDQYSAIQESLTSEIKTRKTTMNTIEADKKELEQKLRDREKTRDRREKLRTELEQQEGKLEEAKDRRDEFENELSELRDEMVELDTNGEAKKEELVDRRTELNTKKNELTRVEQNLEQVAREIKNKKDLENKRDELETQYDNIDTQISELKTRVETVEQQLVDEFNDTIDDVLSLLSYQNLTRVWIDRKVIERSKGTNDDTQFDLNIVREGEDGTYKDRFEHLSESEKAVIGLSVALTGYLVHEVFEECPMMLLDSIEMIDGKRIADLLEYFGSKADYLVAALLPEDGAVINNDSVTTINVPSAKTV